MPAELAVGVAVSGAPEVSIVVPLYRDENGLAELFARLQLVIRELGDSVEWSS